jgi:hypothetical protein
MRNLIRRSMFSYLFLISVASVLGKGQNPSPEFTLAIQAERQSVEVGQTVVINVTRQNITDQTIDDNRTTNPMEYLTFRVSRDGVPVAETAELQKMHGRGLAPGEVQTIVTSPYFAKLKPGESSHDTVEVSHYYDMSKPGTYSISALQETRPGLPEKSVSVKSNTITITVLPAGDPSAAQQ